MSLDDSQITIAKPRRNGAVVVSLPVDVGPPRTPPGRARPAQGRAGAERQAAVLTHDLNNLLTIVLGASERLAVELAHGSEQQELAEICLEAAQRGAELLARLQSLSEPDLPTGAAVNCAEVIETTLRFVRQAAPPTVELWNGATEPVVCRADRAGLEAAVLNLCLNAVAAMPGGGMLALHTSEVALPREAAAGLGLAPGRYAKITVGDNGIGMSPEILTRATEPFFTTRRGRGGTGVGLASVQAFARSAGGALSLASNQGEGAEATLYLPLAG